MSNATRIAVLNVLDSWLEEPKIKTSKMLRAAKSAARHQAENARAAARQRAKTGESSGPDILDGTQAEHLLWPWLGVVPGPFDTEDATIVQAYTDLLARSQQSDEERKANAAIVEKHLKAEFKPNPLFCDPARGADDLVLRYGDPTRAVYAECSGLSLQSDKPCRLERWHQRFLIAAANAVVALRSAVCVNFNFTLGSITDPALHHEIGLATTAQLDINGTTLEDSARLFGSLNRVVLGDTLNYSDGALGALIALQNLPLAPQATISFEEVRPSLALPSRTQRTFKAASEGKLTPAQFRQWASTCVIEEHMEAIWGVKRVHVAGERSNQHNYVWRGNVESYERLRASDVSRLLYTVMLRVACGPHWSGSPPTEATFENLNLNAFFKFVYGLAERGYPHHWLGKALEQMIENVGSSTAVPLPRRPLAYKRLDSDDLICLSPFQSELEVLAALWQPVLPFPLIVKDLIQPHEIGRWRVTFDPIAPSTDKISKKDANAARLDYPNLCLGFFAPYESRLELLEIYEGLSGKRSTQTSLIVLSVFELDRENTVHFLMSKARMEDLKRQRWLVALGPDFKRRVHVRGAVPCGDIDGSRADDPALPVPAPAPVKTSVEEDVSSEESEVEAKPEPKPLPKKAKTKSKPAASSSKVKKSTTNDDDDLDMPGLVPISDAGVKKSKKESFTANATAAIKKVFGADMEVRTTDGMPGLVPVDDDDSSDDDVSDDPGYAEASENDDDYETDEGEDDDDDDDATSSQGSAESMPGLMEL